MRRRQRDPKVWSMQPRPAPTDLDGLGVEVAAVTADDQRPARHVRAVVLFECQEGPC